MRTPVFALAAASAAVLLLAAAGTATADDDFAATGTSVTWSSDEGNGNVTFSDSGTSFQGSAQFPSEGPVGYSGSFSG
ncbi:MULTISPECIES: hypothetical protein [unclassified Streptomyces]|uniref:hypothetical protein n=1 Tax=unclassified Streptomyces TaxID=2593676 RepID=UPI0037F2CFFA